MSMFFYNPDNPFIIDDNNIIRYTGSEDSKYSILEFYDIICEIMNEWKHMDLELPMIMGMGIVELDKEMGLDVECLDHLSNGKIYTQKIAY